MSELQARARVALDRPARGSTPSGDGALFGRPAFDLKGTVASLTVLKLRTGDLDAIERDLRTRVEQMPELFQDAPVVIDGATLEDGIPLAPLLALLRSARLQPIALVGGSEVLQAEARMIGLGVLAPNALRNRADRAPTAPALPPSMPVVPEVPEPAPVRAVPAFRDVRTTPGDDVTHPAVAIPEPPSGSLTVMHPIRGGQVLYAQRGDLVVLNAVNAGAQVIADGNVHVYGALRGRALAGAKGNPDARIFCRSLEAELISIRGEYMLFDQIPADRRGKACQISHEGGQFKITLL